MDHTVDGSKHLLTGPANRMVLEPNFAARFGHTAGPQDSCNI